MAQQSGHSPMTNEITVMLVDDDPVVLNVVGNLLHEYSDLRVVGAFANGEDALGAAYADPPHVMVVDISMPTLSGAEVTRRALDQSPGIHIMAYTSLADSRSLSEMMSAGATGVIYKDASIAAVADAIRATRSGLSVLSPRFTRRVTPPAPEIPLSDTERAILRHVSEGLTNDQIGRRVHLTSDGVKYHISSLSRKLGATNRVTLAVVAVQLGIVEHHDRPSRSSG